MKRMAFLGFSFLLGVVPLTAQSGDAAVAGMERSDGSGQVTTIIVAPFAPSSGCPVAMHALQGSGGGLLAARNGKPVDGPSQRIRLVLTRRNTGQVAAARVRVRGLSGRNRALQALSANDVKPDRTPDPRSNFH